MQKLKCKNVLVDILSTVIYQRSVEVTSMSAQGVFDSLGFQKGFMSMLSSLFFSTRFTEAITKIPKEHATAI